MTSGIETSMDSAFWLEMKSLLMIVTVWPSAQLSLFTVSLKMIPSALLKKSDDMIKSGISENSMMIAVTFWNNVSYAAFSEKNWYNL